MARPYPLLAAEEIPVVAERIYRIPDSPETETPISVFYYIHIEEITGLRATPDTRENANRRVTPILKS